MAPGEVLYALDGTHAVVLLAGAVPAWRASAPTSADGPDIGQLERSLEALGYGFERRRAGQPLGRRHHRRGPRAAGRHRHRRPTGVLELGEVVFAPAAIRVSEVLGDLGSTVRREARVLTATSTEREVAVELEADRQVIVAVGAGVIVGAPGRDGRAGTIDRDRDRRDRGGGRQARPTPCRRSPSRSRSTIRRESGTLDGAPVTVNVVRERRDGRPGRPGQRAAGARGGRLRGRGRRRPGRDAPRGRRDGPVRGRLRRGALDGARRDHAGRGAVVMRGGQPRRRPPGRGAIPMSCCASRASARATRATRRPRCCGAST